MKLLGIMLLALALLAAPGCRRAEPSPLDPFDPSQPGHYPPCPAAHVAVGLQATHYEATQALVRFAADRSPCAGALLPVTDYGTLRAVGVLSDGSDLVGFVGSYNRGGLLVRVDGPAVLAQVDDELLYPLSIAAVHLDGMPAAAVVWGSGSGSSDHAERLDVYAESDLSLLGSWAVTSETTRVARVPGGAPDRLAVANAHGLQVLRADFDATTPPTTGELQVARSSLAGGMRSLHVEGDHARMATAKGVLSWQVGTAPAFLGPVHCRWPDPFETPLPAENVDHVGAVIDPSTPEDTWVLVDGEVEGTDVRNHLYRLRPRGECALIAALSPDHRAVAIGR